MDKNQKCERLGVCFCDLYSLVDFCPKHNKIPLCSQLNLAALYELYDEVLDNDQKNEVVWTINYLKSALNLKKVVFAN